MAVAQSYSTVSRSLHLKLHAVNDALIPTGAMASVSGTPYDFLQPMTVESRIKEGMTTTADGDGMKKAAMVKDGGSGRVLELERVATSMGHIYGLCLETQGFPDAVNHPKLPSHIVNAGKTYKHSMLYKFSF
ncbi:galactose mutarotase-like [Phoenix dactylifera]|uniref:Galactose mutarotase-like n=1 Tax=Phoenix dactylifera TaxID=42345 RepID=A0A8B9A3U5_PHODC|nr:galactose mutarotase-like [Phoenix dactylifera]